MTYDVEIEVDKVEYDSGRSNDHLVLEWLFSNFGTSIGDDAVWDINFDYKRSLPKKLRLVYTFKNPQDATAFALKWK